VYKTSKFGKGTPYSEDKYDFLFRFINFLAWHPDSLAFLEGLEKVPHRYARLKRQLPITIEIFENQHYSNEDAKLKLQFDIEHFTFAVLDLPLLS